MSLKPKWEIRANGIREGGPLYRSWNDAKEAIYGKLGYIYHECARHERDHVSPTSPTHKASKAQSDFLHAYLRAQKQTPRPNLKITTTDYRGNLRTFELNRIQA